MAVRADAKAHRLSEPRTSDGNLDKSVTDVDVPSDRWRQLAIRAWLICGGASTVAVVLVGVLICVG